MGTLAVGFFDGVHLGHQAILEGASAALTFRNHPLSVLAPDRAPRLIMSLDERIAAIRLHGVKEVRVLDFTHDLAALSSAAFAARYLKATVRCGANWRFGKNGEGNPEVLRRLGIPVTVVPYAIYDGAPISSTRIRTALEAGRIEAANAMLGRRWKVEGAIIQGKGEGRKLGYPTINLRPENSNLRLPYGVYEVSLAGVKAIANFGLAPTFGEKAWSSPIWEVHVLGGLGGLEGLGGLGGLELVRFLRTEKKFASIEDLKRQIAADCAIIQA